MEPFSDGEFPFAAQWESVARQAFDLDSFVIGGVTNELAVSINSGTLDQSDTLSVAAGDALAGGTEVSRGSATNVQIDSEGTLTKRYDLVVIGSDGVIDVVKGTSNKVAEAIPSGHTLLAVVGVPNGDTSITTTNLHDGRVILSLPTQALGFDTATQSELDTHAGNASAHHFRYTDAEAESAASVWSEGLAPTFGG